MTSLARTWTLRRLMKPPFVLRADHAVRSFSAATTLFHRRFQSTSPNKVPELLPELSARDQPFYEKGWVDERGLTQFNTLHEIQARCCAVFAENPLFGVYNDITGQFDFQTYAHFAQQVDRARGVLHHLGVSQHDKIGLIANNRWEWAALACAAYSRTASIVPMYEAQLPADWSYILQDSQPKALFCATQDICDRVQRDVVPNLAPGVLKPSVLCLDAKEGEPHAFATLMAAQQQAETHLDQLILPPSVDDLASLIYTSGTTGKPKGVELTHNNIATNVKAVRTIVENPKDLFRESDRSLAFLPWAHSFGQTCELWLGIAHGTSAAISRGFTHVQEDLQIVKPTVLISVPTLFKKVYDSLNNVMETANPRRKFLIRKALELGRKHSNANYRQGPPLSFFESLQFRVLDSLVLSRIRDRLGGNVRYAASAGAATPAEIIHFMDSLGIQVLEGYGLTETSPVITLNSPEQRLVRSVGRPIGGVSVFVCDEEGNPLPMGTDGEICCTGPNIMKGYYNNPEATDEVISVGPNGERMFHTGDMGHLTEDGFVKITGRIKEQFKLENGKYVCPSPIEEAIGMSRFILQVVLVGANRPHTSALVVPHWEALRQQLNVSDDVTDEALANDDRVIELVDAEIQMGCSNHKKFEIPSKWAFVAPFTVANDMLTQKLSIRRHKVQDAYKDLIDSLYGDAMTGEKSEDSSTMHSSERAA